MPERGAKSRTSKALALQRDYSLARKRLVAWFKQAQRDLPFRQTRDPYRIWVSEVMLQQTQVATVISYYQRFIERFPNPASLAAADETEVLKLWEGLGYYRRARSLHAGAKAIVHRHSGEFPEEFERVLALPGIGRYTAGAVLSIALNQPLPILEGNTIRVHSRLAAITDDVSRTATQKLLWDEAQAWIDGTTSASPSPRDINQGLMELGATICKVKQPECHRCPLVDHCQSRARGIEASLPRNDRKTTFEDRREVVVLVSKGSRWLVRKCGQDERWAGLWDFPRFDVTTAECELTTTQAELQKRCGLKAQLVDTHWVHRHAVTRYKIQLGCYRAVKVEGKMQPRSFGSDLGVQWAWVDREELNELPLSVTGRVVVNRLESLMRSQ